MNFSTAMQGTRVYKLPKEGELRIECKGKVFATLLQAGSNTAELFGTELAPRRKYELRRKAAIFSWSGCEIEVEGDCHAYVAEETPMVSYLNVHIVLEARRTKAKADKGYGPKVLVCGGVDVGKSTLCRILSSYAARVGSVPTFVDLDVGQNSITVPGVLAAAHVSKPFDIEQGLTRAAPLAYFFGTSTPSSNVPLYRKQVESLAAELSRHFASKPEARAGGLIVNTCGWTEGDGYELLLHAVRAFKIDVVLVIDHERLYSDIRAASFDQPVECIKLRKSGGVIPRDAEARRADRQNAIREYFYGPANDMHPHTTVMTFDVMKLCRVGGGPQAPSTALPIGAERAVDETLALPLEPAREMVHSLCAVSYCTDVDLALSSNLAGFVIVSNVDEQLRRCHLLAPCAGRLPSVVMLLSDLQSLDSK